MTLQPTTVTMLLVLFWLSVGWVFYGYIGYPLLLALLRSFRRLAVQRAPMRPPLSVIVAVHNGARRSGPSSTTCSSRTTPPTASS